MSPNRIHVTVGKQRRFRRTGAEEIPTVTPATAIAQCLALGTPTYLLRQLIERGHAGLPDNRRA